jgi:hypothetical protein
MKKDQAPPSTNIFRSSHRQKSMDFRPPALPSQNPSQEDLNRVGTYLRAQGNRLSAPKISYSPETHSPDLRKRASQEQFRLDVRK